MCSFCCFNVYNVNLQCRRLLETTLAWKNTNRKDHCVSKTCHSDNCFKTSQSHFLDNSENNKQPWTLSPEIFISDAVQVVQFHSSSWQIQTIFTSVNSTGVWKKPLSVICNGATCSLPGDTEQGFHTNKGFPRANMINWEIQVCNDRMLGNVYTTLSETNYSVEWHSRRLWMRCCCDMLWNWFHEVNPGLILSIKTRRIVLQIKYKLEMDQFVPDQSLANKLKAALIFCWNLNNKVVAMAMVQYWVVWDKKIQIGFSH